MRYGRGWSVAVGVTAALTLVGCSGGDDGTDGKGSDEASPVDVSDGRLCPFLTGEEREKLTLSTMSASGSTSSPRSERKKEREEKLLEECAYRGSMVGPRPIQQLRAKLWEGSVAEVREILPGYRASEKSKRDGITLEKGTVFSKDTVVCDFIAPGRPAADGKPAATVQVLAFVTVRSTKNWERGDSCDALDKAAPLILKKFQKTS